MRKIASNKLKTNFQSSFMSLPRDTETIWRKLLVDSKPYSDRLKRLLIVNTPDCLDMTQEQYQQKINQFTVNDMFREGYISNVPLVEVPEHGEVQSSIVLQFDTFTTSSDNPHYRNGILEFTIICNIRYWQLNDYQLRPWMIAGYIDGMLNGTELSGIGKLQMMGASVVSMNEDLNGVLLSYQTYHSDADDIEKVDNNYPSPQQLAIVDNLIPFTR